MEEFAFMKIRRKFCGFKEIKDIIINRKAVEGDRLKENQGYKNSEFNSRLLKCSKCKKTNDTKD